MKIIAAFIATVMIATLAHGQATRTWVSGVGDDANPCSRTAPGKTFAGAISKTAAGGIISVLDPGGFGAVTVTKAMTFEGNLEGSILASALSAAIIVNAGTNDVVVIRNLLIDGSGSTKGRTGIQIRSAKAVHVEGCQFNNFTNSAIHIHSTATNIQVFVKESRIRNCFPGTGIQVDSDTAAIVLIEDSSITACGSGFKTGGTKAKVTITGSTLSGCTGPGINVLAGGRVAVAKSTISQNGIGVLSEGIISLSDCTIAYNRGDGVKTLGTGKIRSLGNNTVTGNTPNGVPTEMLLPW